MNNLKKLLIISTFLISTLFFIDNVNANDKQIPDNINNYYNITSFYDSDSSTYIDDNYYILKDNLDSMMYDDIEEWASTSNNYSSSSLNTIKSNLLNGNYDSYIENYGPYYITYNANSYNSNKICFFKNYDDIYLQRSYFNDDGVYHFKIYLKDSYCISYEKSNILSEFEKNGELQPFTNLYNETLLDNILYLNNTKYTIYYSDENIIKGLLGNEVTITPTLKLKNTFNSGTNAYGMSKIVWNINAGTDSAAADGVINMKIQYGANDFTNKNIPIFNSYKIYGMNSYESGWTDITDDERFYFDDFIYEYYTLEGVATETILTNTLHIPSDMCIYENIKVEFYFDNTNNFYMYVFDDLDDSSWQDLQYYFENYMYYEFPTDKKYAFISHASNSNNTGKVFVPYNDIINTNSLFGAYIYDLNEKRVLRKLVEREFEEHDYYYYYDFDFSFEKNEILLLQRKTGTDEKVSFYIPSDYIVEFSNDDEKISILTPNGYVDINTSKIENVFSNDKNLFGIFKSFNSNKDDIKKLFNDIWNNITTSIIYEYILILIVGTLIIVIIKGANR